MLVRTTSSLGPVREHRVDIIIGALALTKLVHFEDMSNQAIKICELIITSLAGTGLDDSSDSLRSLLSNKVDQESICHINTYRHVNY